MSCSDAITADVDLSGQALIREFVRRAQALLARGGPIDRIYQRLSALPSEYKTAAQELVLGKSLGENAIGSLENDGAMWLATPKERAAARWRKGISAFLGLG